MAKGERATASRPGPRSGASRSTSVTWLYGDQVPPVPHTRGGTTDVRGGTPEGLVGRCARAVGARLDVFNGATFTRVPPTDGSCSCSQNHHACRAGGAKRGACGRFRTHHCEVPPHPTSMYSYPNSPEAPHLSLTIRPSHLSRPTSTLKTSTPVCTSF